MGSSSTVELLGVQILVVSWTHLFLQQRCFGGGGGYVCPIAVTTVQQRSNVQMGSSTLLCSHQKKSIDACYSYIPVQRTYHPSLR